MNEVINLLFILILFYLVECIFWLDRNSVVFVSLFRKNFSLFFSDKYFGNQHGGIYFTNPFPPLGTIYISSLFPISCSVTHISSHISQTFINDSRVEKNIKILNYQEIKSVSEVDRNIFINGEMFVKCGTPIQAIFVKNILLKLVSMIDEQREMELKKIIQKTFDVESAKEKIEVFYDQSYGLRICCNILFMYIFLFVPVLLWHYGTIQLLITSLLAMYLLSIFISINFHIIHKELYPTQKSERFIDTFKMIIFPPIAVRAHDMLSRYLLINYHPLAIAYIVCERTDVNKFSKDILADLMYPIVNDFGDENINQTDRWHRSNLDNAITLFLDGKKVSKKELLMPPLPATVSCQSYCPRCNTQYTMKEGVCSDCGTITLVPFNTSEWTC